MIWLFLMLAAFAFIGGIGLGMMIQEDLQKEKQKELAWHRRECVFNYPDGSEAIREADENELWG